MTDKLIRLEGNINYLELFYPNGDIYTVGCGLIKRVRIDDNEVVLVILEENPTKELVYWMIENPDTPGSPFYSGWDLYKYILNLMGSYIDYEPSNNL